MRDFLDIPDIVAEVYEEGLEWFLDNPGEDNLPFHIVENMNLAGLDPDRTTLRLLMERDRLNS